MFEKLKSILEEKYEHWGQEIIDDDILDFSKYDLSKEICIFRAENPPFTVK